MSKTYRLEEVFGIARDLPINYIQRADVDGTLVTCIKDNKHIVIHGSSKQGKTCLRKQYFKDTDSLLVQCMSDWDISGLYSNILKQLNYQLPQSIEKSKSFAAKGLTRLKAALGFASASTEVSLEKIDGEKKTLAPIQFDMTSVNDIVGVFKKAKSKRFVILEDFHYLPDRTQRQFASDLKAFHELSSVVFVVIGVWLEENRLIVYNGELSGRIVSINADKWNSEELHQVIHVGAELLNIKFNSRFESRLLAECYDSVYIVQEACKEACRIHGVQFTQQKNLEVGSAEDVSPILERIIQQQKARYLGFLDRFAAAFQEGEVGIHQLLLYPLFLTEPRRLETGIDLDTIMRTIRSVLPEYRNLREEPFRDALSMLTHRQVKNSIRPIIADFDTTCLRLQIVDKAFFPWLLRQNITELMARYRLTECSIKV